MSAIDTGKEEVFMKLRSLIPIGREATALSQARSPFLSLQRDIDQLFDDFTRGMSSFGSSDLAPRMDLVETDKSFELTAELPGLEEKDVEIRLSDNVLTIKGEKKSEKEDKGKNYRLVERSYGSFSRSVELPDGISPEAIKATIDKGVLTVSVPKPAPSITRKIEVKAA